MKPKTLHDIPLELFKKMVQESFSRSSFFRKFNMLPRGAKFKTFNKIVKEHKIDISHFKLGGHVTRDNCAFTKQDVLDKMLTDNYPNKNIKKYIIKFNIIPYQCSKCNLIDKWLGSTLILQLDHINGDCKDNRIENLRFLCPNCHSQTETFAGKNRPAVEPKTCASCNSIINRESAHCIKCFSSSREKIKWPPNQELLKLVWSKPLIKLGQDLGVSDNAIRKRCKLNGIALPSMGFWLKKKTSI